MARNRQRRPNASPPSTDAVPPKPPLIDVPEEEQWRLINESGVLHNIHNTSQRASKEEPYSLVDEILDTSLIIIPICFLLLLFEILIHNQYGRHATVRELFDRMSSGAPILSLFIFYIHRHKKSRRVQIFLFALSCIVGPRLMYLIARGSWMVNMRQCPPLATIWVYTVVELDLGPAVIGLLVTGFYVWWKGLEKYMF